MLLVLVAFILPLAGLLGLAVGNPEMRGAMPVATVLLRGWNGSGMPPAAVRDGFAAELGRADASGPLATRLNFEQVGLRSLLLRTARAHPATAADLDRIDPAWGQPSIWTILRQAAAPLTATYLLRALDLRDGPDGIEPVPPDAAVFRQIFFRTISISLVVTVLCVVLAYPAAALLATQRGRWARIATICVLVPFWTSVLVRSVAWFVLLQREGPMNWVLVRLGLADAPLQLIFTRFAVLLAMVQVLLPFAVLPLLAVLRGIDTTYAAAASSLGAPPWRRFLRVELPLAMPGVAAAATIVFLLSAGFYVTPELVGGPNDQLIAGSIAFFINGAANWGMGAALASLLLLAVLLVVGATARTGPVRTALR